ncbi:hypothetical protein BDR03DRAFT_348964 [Suillus americanus]|nr:hypothetical protein BDR03DRAFT_348964 [Suillus americanus]
MSPSTWATKASWPSTLIPYVIWLLRANSKFLLQLVLAFPLALITHGPSPVHPLVWYHPLLHKLLELPSVRLCSHRPSLPPYDLRHAIPLPTQPLPQLPPSAIPFTSSPRVPVLSSTQAPEACGTSAASHSTFYTGDAVAETLTFPAGYSVPSHTTALIAHSSL